MGTWVGTEYLSNRESPYFNGGDEPKHTWTCLRRCIVVLIVADSSWMDRPPLLRKTGYCLLGIYCDIYYLPDPRATKRSLYLSNLPSHLQVSTK